MLASSQSSKSKSLTLPIRAERLGERPTSTAGPITRRQSFTLSILDDALLSGIEECRKIGDLTRSLSFDLDRRTITARLKAWLCRRATRRQCSPGRST
jgi:hypothetical protein